MSKSRTRPFLTLVLAALGISVLPARAGAQEAGTDEITRRWIVARAPQVDLWFHGMALIGYTGFGAMPLYDPDYAGRIAEARAARGNPSSSLIEGAARFRSTFARDSIYEVFHFLPLYFATSSPDAMFEALRAVANSTGSPDVRDPTARFGAAAAAYVLTNPEQRRVLGEFVDALEDEWTTFYAAYSRELTSAAAARAGQFQSSWDAQFQPALGPYLAEARLDGGVILVSPALGLEGRIFQGDPANPVDNVVAVGFREDGRPNDELYGVVRELCFPVVRMAMDAAGAAGDRVSMERLSGRAAVRCGALVLQQYLPEAVDGYRRSFTGIESTDAQIVARTFREAYPLESGVERALEDAVSRLPPP